jgi:hypothetical protein
MENSLKEWDKNLEKKQQTDQDDLKLNDEKREL